MRSGVRRIGSGEVTTKRVKDRIGQAYFLMEVARLAPQVLRALRDEVLPIYAAIVEEATRGANPQGWSRVLRRWVIVGTASTVLRPALLPLKEALGVWAGDYRLGAPWVLDAALSTLSLWHEEPHMRAHLNWGGSGLAWWSAVHSNDERVQVDLVKWATGAPVIYDIRLLPPDSNQIMRAGHLGDWDPDTETERVFRKRVKEHIASRKALTKEERFIKSPLKTNPEHFSWLVEYQVMGLSFDEVAGRHCPKRDDARTTARAGIRETARLIKLPLRRSLPGRPRKK